MYGLSSPLGLRSKSAYRSGLHQRSRVCTITSDDGANCEGRASIILENDEIIPRGGATAIPTRQGTVRDSLLPPAAVTRNPPVLTVLFVPLNVNVTAEAVCSASC